MRIRRIEVKDFRKLGRALVEDLDEGLNVIVGDNEAGKSTLLAALRAGLFERHRVGGKVAAAMQPYSGAGRPEIAIDFEIDGLWTLRKAFCQRPEAELKGPGVHLVGDAVEDRLAQLFGFTPPGSGGSKPEEHQGVHGLLWVEQGRSHRALGIGAGRDAIASALELEVGQVVGGERGRALLSSAEDRRNAYWDKRGNPRGSFKALDEEVATLRERRGELAAALLAQDEKVALLGVKSEALARHEREGRLEAATRALDAARLAIAGSQRLRATLAAATELTARRRLERAGAGDRAGGRVKLIADAAGAESAAALAAAALGEEREALARREAALRRAEDALAWAREAARGAAAQVRALDLARGRVQAAAMLLRLREQAATAQAQDALRRERLAAIAAVTIEAKDVEALDALDRDRDRTRLQLEAASVRLAFEPDGARSVSVDGVERLLDEPLLLSRDAVLTLEGFGRVTLRPGGGVDALARKAEAAARALADALARHGFPDLGTARAAVATRTEAMREAETARTTLRTLAPQGLDALLQSILEAETLAQGGDGSGIVWSPALRDAAGRAQDGATAIESDAEAAVAAERRAKEAADRAVAAKAERAAAALRERTALAQLLALSRAEVSDEAAAEAATAAENALGQAHDRERNAADALAAADPETATLELKRAEGAERAIRIDIEMLRRERRDLEIELRALGRDGLGEQLAEVEERLAAGERRQEAQGTQARAARLLHDTLAQAQRETRDRWLGPVRERAAPYLRLVQPDSDIVLNEGTLEIESLVRGGISEPFGGLSVGAREQVAVITRLALADILRGADKPSAIILDDALVNTDEDRLHRMHLVLQRAAQTMQVLILTCRERDFLQLGAPIRRL